MHSDPTPPCGPGGIDGGDDGVSRNDWAAEGWYCEHGKYDPERACTNGWSQDHVTRPITGVGDGAIREDDGVEWVCSECGTTPCACGVDGDRLWIGRIVEPKWLRPDDEQIGVGDGAIREDAQESGSRVTAIAPAQLRTSPAIRAEGGDALRLAIYSDNATVTSVTDTYGGTWTRLDHDNDPPAGPGERCDSRGIFLRRLPSGRHFDGYGGLGLHQDVGERGSLFGPERALRCLWHRSEYGRLLRAAVAGVRRLAGKPGRGGVGSVQGER